MSKKNASKKVSYYPDDPESKLENHILGESFAMDRLDYDKIQRQSEELEALRKSK